MKNKILISFLLLFVISIGHSQNITYTYKNATVFDDYFSSISKGGNGTFELLLNENNWSSANKYTTKPSIIIIDSLGYLISKTSLFSFSDSISIQKIMSVGKKRFLFGTKTNNNSSDIYINIMDSCFSSLKSKSLRIDSNICNCYINDVIKLDSSFVLIMQIQYCNESTPRFALTKIKTSNLDSLDTYISTSGIAYSGIKHKMKNSFYIFTYLFNNCGMGQAVLFNDSLKIIKCVTLPKNLHQFNTAVWYNDTTLLISGSMEYIPDTIIGNEKYDKDIGIVLVDTSLNCLNQKYFLNYGTTDFAGWGVNLIPTENNCYYVVGTHDKVYGSNYYPTDIFLAKVDSNLNTIWGNRITDSTASYDVSGIIETVNGSVLLLVWKYNSSGPVLNRDAYIFRVSKHGVLLKTSKILASSSKFTLFPNPSHNTISLSITKNDIQQVIHTLRVFDAQGKKISKLNRNSYFVDIDVSNYPNGLYIIECQTSKGEVFSTKFIKE